MYKNFTQKIEEKERERESGSIRGLIGEASKYLFNFPEWMENRQGLVWRNHRHVDGRERESFSWRATRADASVLARARARILLFSSRNHESAVRVAKKLYSGDIADDAVYISARVRIPSAMPEARPDHRWTTIARSFRDSRQRDVAERSRGQNRDGCDSSLELYFCRRYIYLTAQYQGGNSVFENGRGFRELTLADGR